MPIPDRRPGSEKGISKVLIAVVALFLIYFAAAISLALAANTQGLLTKEEASSGFVNPTFLQFRLQHHLFSTNFYAYVYFLFASKFAHGLFFSRFSKVAVMSTLPCFLYLYLRKRFDLSGPVAFTGALAIALLPGLLCFSWIGMDVGMEEPIGCCALWL